MTRSFSMLKLGGIELPIRRVLAIDPGSRRLKLLLAESRFSHLTVLREEVLDLQAEGMVSSAETRAHVQAFLEANGRPPAALVLPQHVSTSQVLDLPASPDKDVEELIESETVKLSGLSESKIVYDFVRVGQPTETKQQYWVTLSQEEDIRERIVGLGLEKEDLCQVTTTANALLAAYRATPAPRSRAILAHLGAQSTVIVLLLDGHGAFATSFPMGGEFFTRSIARVRGCPEHEAEQLKREQDLFRGPEARPEFLEAVEGWITEFKGQLNDWFARNPAFLKEVDSFPIVASGGGFDMPGLLPYLESHAGLKLASWPRASGSASPTPGFEVAYGAALSALGRSAQPVSLLPADYETAWNKRGLRQKVQLASVALAVLCLLFLALGTWQKIALIQKKEFLLSKAVAGDEAVEATELYSAELMQEYETFRPLFLAQQNTFDTLSTLALLQQSRSNRPFWYVLLADQQTYFLQAPVTATNRPGRTNLLADIIDPPQAVSPPGSATVSGFTSVTAARPGLIAELCVPEDAESARSTLSQLVNDLKAQPFFSRVDLLSEDLRRGLADPKLVIPERHFVLAIDFATTDFQAPVSWLERPGLNRGKTGRRSTRASRPSLLEYNRPEPMLP